MAKGPKRKPSKSSSLRRKVGTRRPKRTFLVFCEGEKTEPDYLKALKREPAVRDVASVDIRIDKESHGAAPLTLVRLAAEARTRSADEEGEVDEVWCLFDVEWPRNHPNLNQAIDIAEDSDVRIAVSNPCFELWLVLHFQDQTAWLSTDEAVRLREHYDGTRSKSLDGASYMPLRADATRRARSLDKRHAGNRTPFPKDNPSSGMYRLLDAVGAAAPRQT